MELLYFYTGYVSSLLDVKMESLSAEFDFDIADCQGRMLWSCNVSKSETQFVDLHFGSDLSEI